MLWPARRIALVRDDFRWSDVDGPCQINQVYQQNALELNPAPPLDWLLKAFDERFKYSDLPRFCVSPHVEIDPKLRFSLVQRPAPYELAPQMSLVSDVSVSKWDDVLSHIARWLVRYLGDPRLIIWIAERGGQIHDRWMFLD